MTRKTSLRSNFEPGTPRWAVRRAQWKALGAELAAATPVAGRYISPDTWYDADGTAFQNENTALGGLLDKEMNPKPAFQALTTSSTPYPRRR